MTGITVTTDWEEVAKRLGEAMSARVRRKAVAETGKEARRDLLPLLADAYSISKAGLGAKAKSPSPGATDPVYTIRMNRRLRLSKLKAGARKFTRRKSATAGLLAITQPQATGSKGVDLFRAVKGEQRGEFILPSRRGRKRRKVGGPILRRGFDATPALAARRDQIVEDLAKNVAKHIEAAMKGKR